LNKEGISGNIVDYRVLKRIFTFVRPYKWLFVGIISLTFFLAILGPIRPYLVSIAIDDHIATNDHIGLVRIIIILIVILLIQATIQYLHTYYSDWLGQHVIRDIRVKLYDHLIHLNLRFLDKTPIGRLVTRNVSDIETLADVFSQGMAAMLGDILQLFVILFLMFYTDWRLTLISLSMLPFLIISTYVFKEKIKIAFNEVRNAVAKLNSFVQEHITGEKDSLGQDLSPLRLDISNLFSNVKT
jgi:ATP-binding cassette subfamily B multidrug efflux pump